MPLEIKCSGCGAAFRVKDELAGKKMKCPKCSKVVTIEAGDEDVIEEVEVVEEEEEKKPDAPAAADPFAFDGDDVGHGRERIGGYFCTNAMPIA